jgi:fused signal recognition particle receptor
MGRAQGKIAFFYIRYLTNAVSMLSFFRRRSQAAASAEAAKPTPAETAMPVASAEAVAPATPTEAAAAPSWITRLKRGLAKTSSGLMQVFTGTRVDDALFEELESALLMADAGIKATEYVLQDLKRRVKATGATEVPAVKALLIEALAELLGPLQQPLVLQDQGPTVMMTVGVNGAGKTTTIGKLTRHFADEGLSVLLAAGDTFRAAAREQLAAWALRNDAQAAGQGAAARVDIVSQEGADPSAVSFDAVRAGMARGKDVVIVDTAGRLPTQLHLMEELKKIQRVIGKALPEAPHQVLLVVDGNTGQNALAQVQAFDQALGLTGLVITKLDGTAKGGVLAAIALWARQRVNVQGQAWPLPVYFIGVGEQLEDLQPFDARAFAQALLQ